MYKTSITGHDSRLKAKLRCGKLASFLVVQWHFDAVGRGPAQDNSSRVSCSTLLNIGVVTHDMLGSSNRSACGTRYDFPLAGGKQRPYKASTST